MTINITYHLSRYYIYKYKQIEMERNIHLHTYVSKCL